MEILQLPMMALQERIDAEMQSNPVLEMREPGVDDQVAPDRDDETEDRGERPLVVDETDKHSGEDFQRLSEFDDEYETWKSRSDVSSAARPADTGERDKKMDAMSNAPAPEMSLNEYLQEQWTFVEADAKIKAAGTFLINRLDDDGYLRSSLEELAAETAASDQPLDLPLLRAALQLVQTLEPPGVGARDLQECLLLQLHAEAATGRDVSLEMELVQSFLRDIELNRLPQVARKTGKTMEQMKAAIANIGHLNPRPGSFIGQRPAPIIMPDVIVDLADDGSIVVRMPDGNLPEIRISREYGRMAKDRAVDKNARNFIQKNIRGADWLIAAIAQRRETVRRVTEEVFKVQREFLEHGNEALKSLPMAVVAEKVGVHVATVSRAVAGKYVQTPRGIFPLRMFFSGGTTTSEGADVSWDAIRVKLKEIIDTEDKANPLDDDELAREMTARGVTIARRTVAKYRGILDIPPARKRKQF